VQPIDAGNYTVVLTNVALVNPGVLSPAVPDRAGRYDGDRLPDTWKRKTDSIPPILPTARWTSTATA